MKFKISKKIVSLFLAVMMVVTSVPAFAINASAAENTKYLFAYFTGDTVDGQKIRFATSSDGKNFRTLNNGNYTVTQKTGTQCARDPYLFYSEKENCYYLLATDYDYSHNNWGDKQSTMTVWKSNDLITWSNETHIDAKNIPGVSFENNLWAPQALWDDAEQKYMVYYSTDVKGSKAVVYSYTSDLFDVTKYSVPQKIGNFAFSNIDADITKVGDEYVLFIKNEDGNSKKIYAAVSSTPNSFSNPVLLNSKNKSFEGPQLYKTSTGYTLAFDEFGNSGNVWLHEFTNDQFASFVANVKTNPSSIDISSYYSKTVNQSTDGFAARHGSIISITDEQYNALQSATFNQSTASNEGVPDFASDSDYLIARYLVNDVTNDTTKKNGTLTNNNGVSWDSSEYDSLGAAQFSMNNNSYLSLNTSMLNGTTANGFTVSLLGKPSSSNTTPNINNMQGRFFEFTTAAYREIDYNTNRDNFTYLSEAHNGIVQVSDKNYDKHIAADTGSSNNYYNDWHLYTVSVSSSGITVYIDGVKSATTGYTGEVTYESFINNLASCNLLIGASGWPDNTYDGYIRDLRVYNKAITDAEASKLPAQYNVERNKSYVENNINNSKSYKFDTKIANADDNYMKNIVYSGNWADSSWTSFNDYTTNSGNKHNFKVTGPSIAVGIYSGNDTDIRFPLISQTGKGDNQSGVTTYIGVDHLAYNDGTFNVGGANWERCNNWNDLTSNSDTGHNFSSDPNGGINRKENSGDQRYQLNQSKTWKNYMTYKGSGNKSTYFDLLTNPSFAYQADYTWSWWEWGTKWGNKSNYTGSVSATNQKFYVINYQPLKELIESTAFKSNFQNVLNNEWKYDELALADYYDMYYRLLSFDLSAQDYSSASAVENVASTIKSLVASYYSEPIRLKKFNVLYTFADGTSKTETITAGTSLAGLIPNNTMPKSNKNGTHSVYTWSDNCSESTVPQKDVTYHETFKDVDCTYDVTEEDGVITSKCNVCGYVKTEIKLNYDAYNAAVTKAGDAIKNTAKYTVESRNELQSVLDNNKSENAKKQSELDAMTTAIETAYNTRLVLNEYTINLYTVIDDVVPDTPTKTIVHKYGEEFTFDSNLGDGYTVQKWVRNVNNNEEKVGSSVTSLTGITYANASYYVYAVKAKDTKENNAVVSLKDRNNRVVDNMYVELTDGTANLNVSVDVNNKCVTVNGVDLNAIDLTFYNIVGFKINGVEYKENTNFNLPINGNLTIETLYDIANSYTITTDDSCSANKSSAYWDEKVTVTAKNGSANTKWYVNDKLVAYGPTYTFRVSGNADIKCVNDDKAPTAVATVESLSYNNPIEKTITVVGSFNVPEDCTVVEKGVLMKTSSVNNPDAVGDIKNYTGKDANARKFIAKNYVKDTNQYVINVYSSKSYTDLCVGAVAYVTYTDASGHQQTAYSDLVVFNQNNA